MVAGLFSYGSFHVKGASEASENVEGADGALRKAFNATLEAERVGANISGLILRLNEAEGVLREAEIALANGNLSEAFNEAGQCVGIAESVKSDAGVLKALALDEAQRVFGPSLTFSVVSIAVFVVVLVLVWRRFRRGYPGKVLGMRPEVVSDEA
jgi:ribosomal protein L35AE/L33A